MNDSILPLTAPAFKSFGRIIEYPHKDKKGRARNLWRIVQLINYGLEGETLDSKELKRVWSKIKARLNPDRRKVLEFFLWGTKWKKEPGLLPNRSNYWIWRSGIHTS